MEYAVTIIEGVATFSWQVGAVRADWSLKVQLLAVRTGLRYVG